MLWLGFAWSGCSWWRCSVAGVAGVDGVDGFKSDWELSRWVAIFSVG